MSVGAVYGASERFSGAVYCASEGLAVGRCLLFKRTNIVFGAPPPVRAQTLFVGRRLLVEA